MSPQPIQDQRGLKHRRPLESLDIYGLRYLTLHLHRADRGEDLCWVLVGDETWMQVKFDALDSGDESFADDLDLALSSFEEATKPLCEDVAHIVK